MDVLLPEHLVQFLSSVVTGTLDSSEWDNLNRITSNVHGSNVVNSAGGIMIQEVKESHVSTKKRTLPLYDRSSKMRSFKITPPENAPRAGIQIPSKPRRGSGVALLRSIIDGPNTWKPYDFKSFLGNELNKKQLCDLLLKVWGSNEAASRIEKSMKAVVCVNGKSYDLTSTNGKGQTSEIYALRSNQEETDSRIVLYFHHAVNSDDPPLPCKQDQPLNLP
ncbi:hypothetical protein PFLUV_G00082050 [Perca fluviatilis]|uniref:Uncharacterized protein n=1 Tax=Perca fluviatilis TaxID=8168 RepID=A0A6A5EEH6_PERFL|nr:uncharacterized protein LOC120562731 [Perca fluviatilis]KAF1387641.1 hypothetical protein PFLUV_G00082050 [Perca fluviatilis]